MTIELDEVLNVGDCAIAAIVERSTQNLSSSPAATFLCAKHPLAVFIRENFVTTAYDVGGQMIDLEELQQRYPAQYEIFESHVSSTGATGRSPSGS